MATRSSKRKNWEQDVAVTAFRIVQEATRESEAVEEPHPDTAGKKNPAAAVALGRLGGKKGGSARARKLTPEQRSGIARKAAQARWHGPTV